MNYKKAIQTAAKFVGEEGILSRLRFIPASGPFPARVYANDGQVGVICDLDPGLDLPNVTADTEMLSSIVKDGDVARIALVDYGAVEVQVGASVYKLDDTKKPEWAASKYLGFPAIPQAWEAELDWAVTQKALHAVAKTHANTALMHVAFRPGGLVFCTDGHRLTRVKRYNASKADALVPAKVFKNWPAREVWSAFDAGTKTAFFRLGLDEVRLACYQRDSYPDVSSYVPDVYEGPEAVIEMVDFQKAVKRASQLSPSAHVRLQFSRTKRMASTMEVGTVRVTAWNEEPQTFAVDVMADVSHDADVVVSGKYLHDALAEVRTPNVWIGYRDAVTPLRIEQPGDYIELIWPFEP